MPIINGEHVVSIQTMGGAQLYQFTPQQYSACTWTRTLRDVSTCTIAVPADDENLYADLTPWLHWVTVWEDQRDGRRPKLVWTGPFQRRGFTRSGGLTLRAVDHSALLSRQRNPITKRWDAADPSWIAEELWDALIDQKGLNVRPIVRPDPEGDRFDFKVGQDAQMLDQTIADLVQLGLRWSVVSGVPILGPVSLDPVATLGELDFLGDVELVRDGAATYNDILLRVPGDKVYGRVPLHGLNLQTIVNVDSLSGVSNAKRAVQQYARHTAAVRDSLNLPGNTQLHPDAPVSLEDLLPSARFVVEAYDLRVLMELESVEVTIEQGSASVSVSMESVIEKPELAETNTPQTPIGARQ